MVTSKHTNRWAYHCPACCSNQKGLVSDDGVTRVYECQECGTFYAVDFSEGIYKAIALILKEAAEVQRAATEIKYIGR